MTDDELKILYNATSLIYLLVYRPTFIDKETGLPYHWDYMVFPSHREIKANRMYKIHQQNPHMESYLLEVRIPSLFIERVPIGTDPFNHSFIKRINNEKSNEQNITDYF